jgi:hypothetical protein
MNDLSKILGSITAVHSQLKLSIRAIHLDLTLALDAVSFLNVFRRFVARRGKPVTCLSDQGTNMKAAKPVICLQWIAGLLQLNIHLGKEQHTKD